ncbi:MAG TPA: DNA-3-methyladenine glycosylase [Cyclobacteriaceae bacterium]|nr:DNA-3-methyladenine glycosylase [Cyclobacteriaceae bacterium]
MILEPQFYQQSNVVAVARKLLGKVLITRINGEVTAGRIVETEAYSYKERGCHAYNNKQTQRNEVMFAGGGVAYVYLCYGIHNLFNIVTNKTGKAEAVLIRALEPVAGEEIMLARMNTKKLDRITSGPGKLTRAFAIDRSLNGISLVNSEITIENATPINSKKIVATTRIGIDYAGTDALLSWRFYVKDNEWVSKW